jgi:uncharacterized protein YbjT (DUF2867 family)
MVRDMRTSSTLRKACGVESFVYTSFSGRIDRQFPFRNAKRDVEGHLKASGLTYTILRPTFYIFERADDTASKQSEELKRLYQAWAATIAATPNMSVDEWRDVIEHWAEVATEPGGVDYIEVEANIYCRASLTPVRGSLVVSDDAR